MTASVCHRDSVRCVTRISFRLPIGQGPSVRGRQSIYRHQFGAISANPRGFWLTDPSVCGVIMVTHMARRRGEGATDPKVAALRAAGALHPHPEAVHDDAFVRHPSSTRAIACKSNTKCCGGIGSMGDRSRRSRPASASADRRFTRR